MKKTILISGILLFCLTSFKTEEIDIYSVIKVVGSIKHNANGKALFTGDKVRSNEKLNFITQHAKAIVISRLKGRFILSSSKKTSFLGLMPAMNNISSRVGTLISPMDIQNYFEGKYLILPKHIVEINEKNFPMNESNFFFLRFEYHDKIISKKILFEKNMLFIISEEILQIDETPIQLKEDQLVTLFYKNSSKNTSTRLAEFILVFPDIATLKMETKIILDEYTDKTPSEKINEITAYFNENYGKANKTNLGQWLQENFNLEK